MSGLDMLPFCIIWLLFIWKAVIYVRFSRICHLFDTGKTIQFEPSDMEKSVRIPLNGRKELWK